VDASRRVLGLLALLFASAASAQQMQIQFAEPVAIDAAPGLTQFDAYGRRFQLELLGNERVIRKLPAARKQQLAGTRLLRGKLAGIESSWVRLTTFDGGVEGVIWDGQELYTVTRYERIASYLTTPIAAAARQSVVYRLSDTLNALPREFCATSVSADGLAANNGLVQFRKLRAELGASAAFAITMTRQAEISLIADTQFQSRFGANTTAQMLANFNVAEGIFGEQALLLLQATDVRTVTAPDPFTATAASPLLDQLETFRHNTAAVAQRGVAHLITGKDLDGDTAGIAIRGQVCDRDNGVSLSEGWLGTSMSGLVMAHELAHNFGAGHDGEGSCAAVPQNFLMSPTINGSPRFSQCSLDAMRTTIDTAACVSPALYAQAELAPATTQMNVENDTVITFAFTVRSTGTQAASNVQLEVTSPVSMPMTAVTPAAGCSVNGTTLACDVGTLAPGQEKRFEISAHPSQMGILDVTANVTAANNQSTRDGSATQVIAVGPNVDGTLSIAASAAQVVKGDFVDFPVTVTSLRSHAIEDARVNVFGGGLEFVSATGAVTCTLATNGAICLLGQIQGNATRQFTVRARAVSIGQMRVDAQLTAANDPFGSNNSAFTAVRLLARRDVAIEAPPVTLNQVAPDQEYELDATVRSLGTEAIDGVMIRVRPMLPSGASMPTSVVVGGQTCALVMLSTFECAIGTMAAGESRPVAIRGRTSSLGFYAFDYQLTAPEQDDFNNDRTSRGVDVRHPVDVRIPSPSNVRGTESLEFESFLLIQSEGINPITSQLVIDVPAEIRITRFFTADGSCAIENPRRLVCTMSFAQAGERHGLYWFGVSDMPGAYQARVAVTSPGDGDTGNDVAQVGVNIAALMDIGVATVTVPPVMFVGHRYTAGATLTVGTRGIVGATATMGGAFGLSPFAVTTSHGSCARTDVTRFECALGDLPGGTTVNLIGTFDVTGPGISDFVFVTVGAPGDNDGSNNARNVPVQAVEAGDLQVTSAASTVTGTVGSNFSFPRISIRRAGPAVGGHVEITLPAFVALNSMSASISNCVGTTTLQCDLPSGWPESEPLEIDLTLSPAAAGTFTSTIRVTSTNDTNATNDQVTVAMTVNPVVTTPPPSSGGGGSGSAGGGGGGSLEWVSLVLLGAIARRRLVKMTTLVSTVRSVM
jgi:hypothetical protein